MKGVFIFIAVCFLTMGALMIGIGIDDIIEKNGEAVYSFVTAAFAIAFGLGYYPFVRWLSKRNQGKINQTMSLMSNDTEEVYKFDDEKIFIYTTRGEHYRSAVETDYDYLYGVVEDEERYYLYISKVQCHVLSKKDIVSGTIQEFNALLGKKLGMKFKGNLQKLK